MRRHLEIGLLLGLTTQGGNALPWNDHGYYEIALDAGAVTRSR